MRLFGLRDVGEMPGDKDEVVVGKGVKGGIFAPFNLSPRNEDGDEIIKKKLKNHKSTQHDSVLKESDELKKQGLSNFVKKKFK